MAIHLKRSVHILSLLLLIACNNNTQITQQESKFSFNPLSVKQTLFQENASIFGEWKLSIPFYSCELSINKDSTFKFHSQGCTAQRYSEGNWTYQGTYLILHSHEKFNNPKNVNSFGPSDTFNVYFKKKTLILEKDTLIELNNDFSKSEAKYALNK